MHYSRILASVALVAVSCGAPLADKSSTSVSHSVTPAISASSAGPTGYDAAVTHRETAVYPPPTGAPVPFPAGDSDADSKGSTYDVDGTFAVPEPVGGQVTPDTTGKSSFGKEFDAPFDTVSDASPSEEEDDGNKTAFDKAPYDAPTTFEEEPKTIGNATEVAPPVFVDEPKTKAEKAPYVYDVAAPSDFVDEPHPSAEDAKAPGVAPAVALDEPQTGKTTY